MNSGAASFAPSDSILVAHRERTRRRLPCAFRDCLEQGKTYGERRLAAPPFVHLAAFGLLVGLAVWRLVVQERASRLASKCYLILVTIAVMATMMGAGYWGGEMIIGK